MTKRKPCIPIRRQQNFRLNKKKATETIRHFHFLTKSLAALLPARSHSSLIEEDFEDTPTDSKEVYLNRNFVE